MTVVAKSLLFASIPPSLIEGWPTNKHTGLKEFLRRNTQRQKTSNRIELPGLFRAEGRAAHLPRVGAAPPEQLFKNCSAPNYTRTESCK